MLFRIDVYFIEDNVDVEVDEKGHVDRYLIFEMKRQEALEKTIDSKFITINTSSENYDADYKIGEIQTFLASLKNKKLTELEKENEKLKEKIIKDSEKKRKINIPPKQKIEHIYCISCKKYPGNSHISSKTINNKVKLLKTTCLKCEHNKSMFLKQIHK